MRRFWVIWGGQLVSQMSSAMSTFAIGVWIFRLSGSVEQFALIDFSILLPYALMGPIAGALADRYDRRSLMILADVAGALRTLFILERCMTGQLDILDVYISNAAVGVTGSIGAASWNASVALLVPKECLGRANGLMQFNFAIARIVAPSAAAALLKVFHLPGVLFMDFISFLFSIGAFLLVTIPNPVSRGVIPTSLSVFSDMSVAWSYLKERVGLMHLIVFYGFINCLMSIVVAVYRPMVLAFASAQDLGIVIASVGAGAVIGNAILAAWGGAKNMMKGLIVSALVEGICLIAAGARNSVVLLVVAGFLLSFAAAFVNGYIQSILQKNLDLSVQGRVLGTAASLTSIGIPIGRLVAGPICDDFLEPSLREGGRFAGSIGSVIGIGPGRGMGMLIIVNGCLVLASALYVYYDRNIRVFVGVE